MDKNWSMDLEHGEYAKNIEYVIEDAIKAVEETGIGYYVNLVTPSNFGHPEDFLTEALETIFQDTISMKFIDQCGCGGYVLRVWKNK